MDVPVFEYRCSACEVLREVIVLPGEQAPRECPECGGRLRRRWSRVGVQLVGWGFARNDALVGENGSRKPYRTVRDKAAELFE